MIRANDRQKLITHQADRSRIFFIKEIFKANKALNGFIVTRRDPSSIKFFPDTEKLNKYIIRLGEKDLAKMMNDCFVFQCQVKENSEFLIKFLS